MALAKTLWTTIQNLVSTGQNVSDMLDYAFDKVDLAITQVDSNTESIAGINYSMNSFAVISGQTTATYSLTTTQQPIVGYSSSHAGNQMTSSAIDGTITVGRSGWYAVEYTADLTFVSKSFTRSITLALNSSAVVATSVINIPKDASRDTESLVMTLYLTANESYKVAISASENMNITFNAINFAIKYLG